MCVEHKQAHHRQDNGGTVRIGALSTILRIATQDRSNRIASSCLRDVATLSLCRSLAPQHPRQVLTQNGGVRRCECCGPVQVCWWRRTPLGRGTEILWFSLRTVFASTRSNLSAALTYNTHNNNTHFIITIILPWPEHTGRRRVAEVTNQ